MRLTEALAVVWVPTKPDWLHLKCVDLYPRSLPCWFSCCCRKRDTHPGHHTDWPLILIPSILSLKKLSNSTALTRMNPGENTQFYQLCRAGGRVGSAAPLKVSSKTMVVMKCFFLCHVLLPQVLDQENIRYSVQISPCENRTSGLLQVCLEWYWIRNVKKKKNCQWQIIHIPIDLMQIIEAV